MVGEEDVESAGKRARSWWRSLPGILTAMGALVTALVGLITVLNQIGVIGRREALPSDATGSGVPTEHAERASGVATVATTGEGEHRREATAGKVAGRLVGRWTWDGQACEAGPHIAHEGAGLVFTTASTRFVHRILSDDSLTMRTEIVSPLDHKGEIYRFELSAGKLQVREEATKELNVWTRCEI